MHGRGVSEQIVHSWSNRLEAEFHIDPLLGQSICHAPWPKINPIVHPTSYPTHQLTPLSFQVSRPSYSWDRTISIFYLDNPRPRSSVRSKFKVTTSCPTSYGYKSHFCHVIPPTLSYDTAFFKISPWKFKAKIIAGSRYNTLSTHIPFVRWRWALAFLYTAI